MVPRSSCTRRQALAIVAGVVGVSGCTTQRQSTDADGTTERSTSTTESTARTTTATETCSPSTTGESVDNWLPFGAWYTTTYRDKRGWRITVTDVELVETFYDEKTEETYRMPEERRLAIVTTRISNPTSERDTWEHGEEFVVLSDGVVEKPNNSFEHPDGPFYAPNLRRIEHMDQYTPHGYPIKPGETHRLWWVSDVPRNFSPASLQVGFDTGVGSNGYDVRWLPARICN